MRTTLIAIFFLLASVAKSADAGREAQADDIVEAAFRYKFAHNGSGMQNKAKAYFLAIGDLDPSDEFMKRFVSHRPPVRKGSACRYDGGPVLDRKTGEKGLLFYVKEIKWKSDTEVEVEIGYHEYGGSSDRSTYTLKKDKGRWKVTNTKLDMIS